MGWYWANGLMPGKGGVFCQGLLAVSAEDDGGVPWWELFGGTHGLHRPTEPFDSTCVEKTFAAWWAAAWEMHRPAVRPWRERQIRQMEKLMFWLAKDPNFPLTMMLILYCSVKKGIRVFGAGGVCVWAGLQERKLSWDLGLLPAAPGWGPVFSCAAVLCTTDMKDLTPFEILLAGSSCNSHASWGENGRGFIARQYNPRWPHRCILSVSHGYNR